MITNQVTILVAEDTEHWVIAFASGQYDMKHLDDSNSIGPT